MKAKKFDIKGVDGDTFLTVGESFEGDRIILSITEQGKVTGIVSLDALGWHDLCDCHYKLDVKEASET